jgi:hypothetical protein
MEKHRWQQVKFERTYKVTYTINPPYIIRHYYPNIGHIIDYKAWCRKNIGRFNKHWTYDSRHKIFLFSDGQDALAFKLSWGIK